MEATSLTAVLAKLQVENEDLQARLTLQEPYYPRSSQKHCFSVNSSREHLERELQRARNKHDQALQRRQQQVVELQQLTAQSEEMLQGMCRHLCCRHARSCACGNTVACCWFPGAPRHKRESPVQRTVAQLEAQLAVASRQMQCAISMQHYLQQAEQQCKQELLEGEVQVRCLRDALGKAQDELQQVSSRLGQQRHAGNAAACLRPGRIETGNPTPCHARTAFVGQGQARQDQDEQGCGKAGSGDCRAAARSRKAETGYPAEAAGTTMPPAGCAGRMGAGHSAVRGCCAWHQLSTGVAAGVCKSGAAAGAAADACAGGSGCAGECLQLPEQPALPLWL